MSYACFEVISLNYNFKGVKPLNPKARVNYAKALISFQEDSGRSQYTDIQLVTHEFVGFFFSF